MIKRNLEVKKKSLMLNLKGICDVEKISPGQTHGKYFGFVPTHLLPVLPSKSSPPPTGIIVEMNC